MNLASNDNMQKAMQRGIITKENLHAVVERSRAFEQRFGEYPRLNIGEGSMAGHKQVEALFFQKEHGIELMMDHDVGYLSMTNTVSNTLVTVDYEHEYGLVDVTSNDKLYTVAVEKIVVNEADAAEYPHLADKLSKLRVVNNNGEPIDGIMKDLKAINPTATWVEKNDLNDFFVMQKVVGHGKDREAFMNEFEGNTGPKVLQPRQSFDYDDGMAP